MDFAAPYKGNFICSIQCLGKHIKNSGGRLWYIFPSSASDFEWTKELERKGEHIIFIESSFFSKRIKFRNIKLINSLINNEEVNIIHTHFVNYNLSLIFLKYFIHPHVRIIGHFHNLFIPPNNKFKSLKVLLTQLTFDFIIGVSNAVAASVKATGIKSDKIACVPNAVDFDRLENNAPFKISSRSGQKVIMITGWPFYIKGIDTAIEAVSQLNKEGHDAVLAIILSGANELFKKEIISQIGTIPCWVIILKPRDDIATYYNNADIFLSASREEGFSYSLVEAAYCQPLLISSDIPAPLSLKIPFIYTFKVGDAVELKNLLNTALTITKGKKEEIKRKQKEFVVKEYDLNNWADTITGYYVSHN